MGDEVEVKILDFNRRKHQIKLSMRALEPEPESIEGVTITSPENRANQNPKQLVKELKRMFPGSRTHRNGDRAAGCHGKSEETPIAQSGKAKRAKAFRRAGKI